MVNPMTMSERLDIMLADDEAYEIEQQSLRWATPEWEPATRGEDGQVEWNFDRFRYRVRESE